MARRLLWLCLVWSIAAGPGCQQTLVRKTSPSYRETVLSPSPKQLEPQTKLPLPPVEKLGSTGEVTQASERRDIERPTRPTSPEETPATEPTAPAELPPAALAAQSFPLVEALRCILEERHQEALRHLQAYDGPTQEIFLQLLPTLAALAQKRIDQLAPQDAGVLYEQLQGLLVSLRPRTELSIDNLAFCRTIKGYGNYEPLPADHAFVAEGEIMSVYFEVRNFASESKDAGYRTHLPSTLEIRDAQGNVRQSYSNPFDQQPQRSQTRLHDYCNRYFFLVPKLEPGVYQLTLQVVDETVPELRRVARKSLEFRVTAAPLAAAR
jgi:hypothetical protein